MRGEASAHGAVHSQGAGTSESRVESRKWPWTEALAISGGLDKSAALVEGCSEVSVAGVCVGAGGAL